MARSMTRAAMLGTTILAAAIRSRAALLPSRSILSAACSVSSRACAISQKECAMSSRTEPCSASGLPKAVRDTALAHQFQRALRRSRSAACSDGCGRAPADLARSRSRGLRRAECSRRARAHSRRRSRDGRPARRRSRRSSMSRTMRTPGVFFGTRIMDCCRCRSGSSGRSCPSRSGSRSPRSSAPWSTTCGR